VIRDRVALLRGTIPDVALRTTCIVGFPGETERDFESLLEFLEEVQFDRVGAFTYSPQEGTRAFDLADDVPDEVKRERLERLTELQLAITAERYDRRVGKTVQAIIDRPADDSGFAEARTVWQADDVDGITRVRTDAAAGTILEVRIDGVENDYDFEATALRVVSAPLTMQRRAGRALPMLATTIGSFGR
jgi:ribosomal protein S12 methylthiotransferase